MKILFVGVLDVYWSTNLEMKRVLKSLGHDVDDFNYRTIAEDNRRGFGFPKVVPVDKFASGLHRLRWLPGIISNWYWRRAGRGRMRLDLMEMVKRNNYDLVLFAKTDTLHFDALSDVGEYCPTWYYFMDPSETSEKILAKEFAKRATWSSATSSAVVAEFEEHGANSRRLIQGFEGERFFRADPSESQAVVFAGTRSPDREHLVSVLRAANIEVKCFGVGWDTKPVFTDELVAEYQDAAIVLNFCRDNSIFSVRVVQAMACGAFVLSQRCDDLAKYFHIGEHLDQFETPEQLVDKVNYYLENPEQRIQTAERGAEHVHENFTWVQLMSELLAMTERGIVVDQ